MSTSFWWCPGCGTLMELGLMIQREPASRMLCYRHTTPVLMMRLRQEHFEARLKGLAKRRAA